MACGKSSFRDSFKRKLEATGGMNCKNTHNLSSPVGGIVKRSRRYQNQSNKDHEVCRLSSIPPLQYISLNDIHPHCADTLLRLYYYFSITTIFSHWGQVLTLFPFHSGPPCQRSSTTQTITKWKKCQVHRIFH